MRQTVLFASAIDYLRRNGIIKSNKEAAALMDMSETSLSRIINDKVKRPSADSIKKIIDGFPFFNPEYFYGRSDQMLLENVKPSTEKINNVAAEDFTPPIPEWANSLIDIIAKQIKENENLNRELRASIKQVNTLVATLSKLIKTQKE